MHSSDVRLKVARGPITRAKQHHIEVTPGLTVFSGQKLFVGTTPAPNRPNEQYRYLKSQRNQLRKLTADQRYETDTERGVKNRLREGWVRRT